MNYEIIGLIAYVLLFGIGLYVYLFTRGVIKMKTAEQEQKAQAFRNENGRIMRIASLLLMAVMLINVWLSIQALFLSR